MCPGVQKRYGTAIGTLFMHYNPVHRWYYLPDMTPDEMILFKGYDSDAHDAARAAHSSFDNRAAYPQATPRKSIESGSTCTPSRTLQRG